MGLSNFPSAADGMLPIIVMNTLMSVAILKKLVKSFLEIIGASNWIIISTSFDENPSSNNDEISNTTKRRRARGISFSKFSTNNDNNATKRRIVECCVCLSKFKEEEEVSELSCKHLFHKNCLEKWFDNHHSTCPLCRSIQ